MTKPTDTEIERVMQDTGMGRMQAYRHVEARIALREKAAAKFPEYITDSMGRNHPNVPRAAILRGDWDNGALVGAGKLVPGGEL